MQSIPNSYLIARLIGRSAEGGAGPEPTRLVPVPKTVGTEMTGRQGSDWSGTSVNCILNTRATLCTPVPASALVSFARIYARPKNLCAHLLTALNLKKDVYTLVGILYIYIYIYIYIYLKTKKTRTTF